MVRAVLECGRITPIEPLPSEWADGRKLLIQESREDAPDRDGRTALEREFRRLAEQWKDETRFLSFSHQIALHSAYQRIIGMGDPALPLILQELQRDPHHWFWALRAITGEDPVPSDSQGEVAEMASAWVRWGRERGIIG